MEAKRQMIRQCSEFMNQDTNTTLIIALAGPSASAAALYSFISAVRGRGGSHKKPSHMESRLDC